MKRFTVVLFLLIMYANAARSEWVTSTLQASLDTGSLAGTSFAVSFSYDSSQVQPVGESYVQLNSFDFSLLGVQFTRQYIFQGGQVIFQDGVITDVTASFQVLLPPNSPVQNITFGFGGPGVIGYIDLNGQSGGGSKVTCLMGMPSARGLFHAACVQSGGGGNFADAEQSRALADNVLVAAGELGQHAAGLFRSVDSFLAGLLDAA